MVKEAKALSDLANEVELEEMTDDDMLEAVGKMDEAEEGASAMQTAMIMNLAELCGGTREKQEVQTGESTEPVAVQEVVVGGNPSFEDLSALPYRVLQAFSQWLMMEIRPKRTTPGTNN
jgi:hypothetical protein